MADMLIYIFTSDTLANIAALSDPIPASNEEGNVYMSDKVTRVRPLILHSIKHL